MAAAAAAAALLLLAAAHSAAAIPYVHDDLLWTKQNWGEYRLPFPWAAVLKERDVESTRALQGPLRGFAANSLNGPVLDSSSLAQLVQEDARRPPIGVAQHSSLEILLLDESASVEAAAGVASCKVCGSLAKLLWGGLTHWVNLKQQVPSKKRIAAYAAELCEYEVPNDVLQGWVLLRARVQQAEGLPFEVEDGEAQQGREFYLLSQRTKQHATPTEISSVRKACHALLQEDGTAGDPKRHLLHQASALLHEYHRQLAQRLRPDAAESSREAVEPVDDGPSADRTCYNRHPQCELWREKGECDSNAQYMVGDSGSEGWCRPACGTCTPAHEPHSLSAEDAAHMAEAAASALSLLQSQACLSAAPCKWAAGAGMQQLLAKARKSAGGQGGEAARAFEGAAYISGPVLSRQQQLEAALDPERLKDTKPMLVRPLADALVPEKKLGKLTLRTEQDAEGAPAVLAKELKDKCLYVNTGWWMYQLCYKRHITQLQFHMTEKLEVDWVISLGKYEGANWTLGVTDESGLYPHTAQVPFASHAFGEGNHCELEEGATGSGQKRAILRRTELRLMCSPDQDAHITVSEPKQCTYLLELYMPQLCKVEGYTPVLPAGMADALDAAWNNGGGGGGGAGEAAGAAAAPRTSRLTEQQAARRAAARRRAEAEEDEDPYVDPDELESDETWGEDVEGEEEAHAEL